jgi:hypothetical protein
MRRCERYLQVGELCPSAAAEVSYGAGIGREDDSNVWGRAMRVCCLLFVVNHLVWHPIAEVC